MKKFSETETYKLIEKNVKRHQAELKFMGTLLLGCGLMFMLTLVLFFLSRTPKALKSVQKEIVAIKEHSPLIKVSMLIDLSHISYEVIRFRAGDIRITAYNNEVAQNDSTPHTMASNRSVYEGAVAISQDIINKHNLLPGDYVCIPKLGDNCYVYEDKMAYGRKDGERKIINTIDVFMYDKQKARRFNLKDKEVVIYRIPRNQ